MAFAAMVTLQDMEDTFLPAFQAGVERGNASGVMCSYAAVTYGESFHKQTPCSHIVCARSDLTRIL